MTAQLQTSVQRVCVCCRTLLQTVDVSFEPITWLLHSQEYLLPGWRHIGEGCDLALFSFRAVVVLLC